nr:MAG: protein B [Sichuan forest noda-like virus 4]
MSANQQLKGHLESLACRVRAQVQITLDLIDPKLPNNVAIRRDLEGLVAALNNAVEKVEKATTSLLSKPTIQEWLETSKPLEDVEIRRELRQLRGKLLELQLELEAHKP